MLEPTPLFGGNADFLDSLYEQYLRNPGSVEPRWREYFERLAPAVASEPSHAAIRTGIAERARQAPVAVPTEPQTGDAKQAAVSRLIQIWVNRGHLIAKLDPLGLMERPRPSVLDLGYFGLSEADLDREFFTGSRTNAVPKRMTLRQILAQLEYLFAGPIGAEFAHVSDSEERLWLQDQFTEGRLVHRFSPEER